MIRVQHAARRGGRPRRRVPWRALLLAAATIAPWRVAHADLFALQGEGLQRIDEVRQLIAPVPLFESGEGDRRVQYIRGLLLDVEPPKDRRRGPQRPEGRAHLLIVAVGPGGQSRSRPVKLPGPWLRTTNEFDTLRDLRHYVGNYDRVHRVLPNSRAYVEHFLAALDPDGQMGLGPRRPAGATRPAGVVDGPLVEHVRSLRETPERRSELIRLAGLKSRTPEELQYDTFGHLPAGPDTTRWIRLIALDRRYGGVYERGLAEAVRGVMDALLRLGALEPGRFAPLGFPGVKWDHLTGTASGILDLLGRHVRAASPGTFSMEQDDPRLVELLLPVLGKPELWWDADAMSRLRIAYEARRAAGGMTTPTPEDYRRVNWPPPQRLLNLGLSVDPSELATVALEVLRGTDAVWYVPSRELVDSLLSAGARPPWPDPRGRDRVRVRPDSLKLLVRLMSPPASPEPRLAEARRAASQTYRQAVMQATFGEQNSGIRRFALEALQAAGWGPADEVARLADGAWGASSVAAKGVIASREAPAPSDQRTPAIRRSHLRQTTEQVEDGARVLAAIWGLERSPRADLHPVADRVRQKVADARAGKLKDDLLVAEAVTAARAGGAP